MIIFKNIFLFDDGYDEFNIEIRFMLKMNESKDTTKSILKVKMNGPRKNKEIG